MADPYREALKHAKAQFADAKARHSAATLEVDSMNVAMAKLRRTITGLAAMCSESPEVDSLGITDSVAEVMENLAYTVTTAQVVTALEQEVGFDFSGHKNAAGSVHAILKRLEKRGLVTRVADASPVAWRGKNYDPETEDVPF